MQYAFKVSLRLFDRLIKIYENVLTEEKSKRNLVFKIFI